MGSAHCALSRVVILACNNRKRTGVGPQGSMRYKVWRSNKDKDLYLLCREGAEEFNALPAAIRHLGPWSESKEGEIEHLRLPYRVLLAEQGFVLLPGDGQ